MKFKSLICKIINHKWDESALQYGHLYCDRCKRDYSELDYTPSSLRIILTDYYYQMRYKLDFLYYKIKYKFVKDDECPF